MHNVKKYCENYKKATDRKAIGEKKLLDAEKQKHYGERKNSAERKLKDKLQISERNAKIFIKIQKNIRSI